MYGLGASTYSDVAESAAFKKLHTLNIAINQLKAQENWAGIQSVAPYYKAALDEYRRIGNADPEYLNAAEQTLLSLGNVGAGAVSALDTISKRLLVGGVIAATILFLWKRR